MNTVIQVAEYKRVHNLPVLNSGREQEVLDRYRKLLENPEYGEALGTWMQTAMDLSREAQRRYLENCVKL